ncbi:hypothetical protein K469DRAFT_674598 [Zopfia rhizophila CBS 207.26]|uniref:Tat pathway signal sequence n=1 Tax=Zopfia rhizophila CBS 207.26 TaxID=1314779 RepID=A0A6A6DHH5_9PEZI|nr:hypothetical protein K469DRAFT_674598 [Zopfia rhizophila CBS 207.26]
MFGNLWRETEYNRVVQKGDSEVLLPSSSTTSLALQDVNNTRRSWSMDIALLVVLLSGGLTLLLALWVGLRWMGAHIVLDPDNFCISHISQYSPIVKEVEPNWHEVWYNGSFLHENSYRGPAGPETDAAWDALGINYRSVVIPASEAERTGLRPDQVKVSQYYGGGYPANVEGLHHLHCLDLLRRALWWNYEYYLELKEGAFTNSEYIVRHHVTHCLDIIRQQLMCKVDVGVLGQVWYQPDKDGNPLPFVDFNTKHKCRDYDTVRKWAEAHQLPPETEVEMDKFYEPPKPGDFISPEVP